MKLEVGADRAKIALRVARDTKKKINKKQFKKTSAGSKHYANVLKSLCRVFNSS